MVCIGNSSCLHVIRRTTLCAALVLALTSSRLRADDQYIYVIDEDYILGTLNLTTGATTVIGNTGVVMTDIALSPNGTLLGMTATKLYRINRSNAHITDLGAHGIPGGNALVFGPNGLLYGAGRLSTSVYTVNTGYVESSPVWDDHHASAGDLAFDGTNLYLSSTLGELVRLELSSHQNPVVGFFSFPNVQSLAIADDGVLYGISGKTVFSINTTTGVGTELFTYTGLGNAVGAASIPASQLTPTPAPTPTPTPTPTPPPYQTPIPPGGTISLCFGTEGGDDLGWIGGAVPGFGGSTSVGYGGLCMSVPAAGDNFVLWVSRDRTFELLDGMIYRARVNFTTDQTAPDAIPALFVAFDNFDASGSGNNYGGYYWVLDVDGGANGIGRPQGRSVYDFYIAPNAINTPQWKAQAFAPGADSENDFRLQFRIIDANPTILTDNDSGSICIVCIEVTAIPRSNLGAGETVYSTPLSNVTHFPFSNADFGGGSATIDDVTHEARYQLLTVGDNRATLGPYDQSQPRLPNTNLQLFPVIWEANTLYRVRTKIRAELSLDDPIEVLLVGADTCTSELGMSLYTTRGARDGPMDRAASPKLAPAEYEGYFFSQNATTSQTPNSNRLRPLAFFFNAETQGNDSTGGDVLFVESLEVDKLIPPS